MARLFRQLHALIDGGVSGNAIEKLQLKGAEAESDENFRIEPGIGTFQSRANLGIQPDLPAKHAQHQGGRQIAVGDAERIDFLASEQIVRVGLAALDGEKNVEGSLARGRDSRHGAQPRRASAASGFPRRNSAASRRFLPSSCTSAISSHVLPAQATNRRWFSMRTDPGAARPSRSASPSCTTPMRCTISFLPSRAVNAPGQG